MCSKHFSERAGLTRHFNDKHVVFEKLPCEHCHKVLGSPRTLKNHLKRCNKLLFSPVMVKEVQPNTRKNPKSKRHHYLHAKLPEDSEEKKLLSRFHRWMQTDHFVVFGTSMASSTISSYTERVTQVFSWIVVSDNMFYYYFLIQQIELSGQNWCQCDKGYHVARDASCLVIVLGRK